jgi:hypothetical protein
MINDAKKYLKRMTELREQIEKRSDEKTIEQIYNDVFKLLKTIVIAKAKDAMIEEFDKAFVKKGKFAPIDLRILKDIVNARADFKKGKLNSRKVDEARKNASILINDLIEYNQRCEIVGRNSEEK